MPRYFIEVAYKGTNYAGFQIQQNANSIQAEVEKALEIFYKKKFTLTGASRTDAGVHALQNFFHFDTELHIENKDSLYAEKNSKQIVYHLNAILPWDISVNNLFEVGKDAHCRFDAIEREYKYYIYFNKDPFLKDRAYYYPYKLEIDSLHKGAEIIALQNDFTSFSKRSTQVNNFLCSIKESFWTREQNLLIYTVSANRFLRGMVRGLVGTMLMVGREKISIQNLEEIFAARDCSRANFSTPAHGLFLQKVIYP